MIIAANPSTLVNLARFGDQEKETLIRDIHDGTLSDRFDIPAAVRADVATTHPARSTPNAPRELEEIVRRTGTLYPKDYWPKDCHHRQLDGRQRRRLPAALSRSTTATRRCATSA